MSKLARLNIYKPEFLFFEMQQFRQNYVCWFSGPYNTCKMKFSNQLLLEMWRNQFKFKLSPIEIGSCFYQTNPQKILQLLHKKTSLWYVYMNNWILGVLIGFQNALRVRGVGYRFDISPLQITIHVGYSHLVSRKIPLLQSLVLSKKATLFRIKHFDLVSLNVFLSSIRNLRQPDVYKGKGIRYQMDSFLRKQGKKKK